MELKKQIEQLPETVRALIGHGLQLVETESKAIRKKLEKAGYSVDEVDDALDLLRGKGEEVGLLSLFGVKDVGDPEDPDQIPMFEEEKSRDYRTHDLNTEQVGELVAGIVADSVPARAIGILNGLEEGERQREGGSRESVLKVIRQARSPLVKRVGQLKVSNGGAHA